jgi:Domain of unknown function (DUF4440)
LTFGKETPMTNSEVEQVEERLRRAMLASDVPELDRLLSDRLMFVTPDGATLRKEGDLSAHRSGLIRISALTPLHRHIEQFGMTAVVNVEMEMAGSFAGAPMSGRYKYTRVWHHDGAQIKVVAGHVCAIQAV